jgi:MFS family permease
MDAVIAVVAAAGATAFAVDLIRDARRRRRPHIVAYAVGMSMFAAATIALAVALTAGWSAPTYRIFYLFGAVLNIPYLALGSVYLVIGPRSGRFTQAVLIVFTVIATLVVLGAMVVPDIAQEGVPSGKEVFDVAWPRIMAAIGGAVGATLLVVLGIVSIFRFWRRNRRIVWGSALIVAGTVAAASGGTALAAVGEGGAFAISLLVAVALIWAGYRVASGSRSQASVTS